MITPDLSPIFPGCPTFGFSMQPDILVRVTEREGGYELRDRKWQHPRRLYEGAPMGPRPQRDIEKIYKFWLAIGGNAEGFRFKDWADFKSCDLDDTPAATDQPLVYIPGSPGGYQLYKSYVDEFTGRSYERPIYRAKGDTVKVANQAGVLQAASTWTLDEGTGLIVPNGGFSGTPTSWGGEFYVWVRFDGGLRVELVNHKIQSLNVTLKELRPEQ